jgi:hypothetical protein
MSFVGKLIELFLAFSERPFWPALGPNGKAIPTHKKLKPRSGRSLLIWRSVLVQGQLVPAWFPFHRRGGQGKAFQQKRNFEC